MALSDQSKRIVFGVVFVVAVGLIALLLYFVFFRSSDSGGGATTNGNRNIANQNSGLPSVNEPLNVSGGTGGADEGTGGAPDIDSVAIGGLTRAEVLTPDINTRAPSISSNGSVRFYRPDDGKFYTVDETGNIKQLGKAQFRSVENITWADTTNDLILEFPDGSNIYYNLDTGRQVTLPKEYKEFDFAPTGSQIAFKYMHEDPERRVLAVSSPDGASARTLESLGENADRVQVNWSPTGKVVASYAEFIDFNRQEVGFLGLNNENFKGTVVEGSGLRSQYSPDGVRMLYSVYSSSTNYNPTLWVVDANGEDIGKNRKALTLPTFADKCAFQGGGESVYCGVPSESISGYGLEPRILEGVPDDIYRIDVKTGIKQKIAIPVDNSGKAIYTVDYKSMIVSKDGKKLFFKDQITGQLIKIDLE